MTSSLVTPIWDLLNPIDVDELASQYRNTGTTRYFVIDNFLKEDALQEIVAAFPTYSNALEIGRQFTAVMEKRKIQVTNSKKFPDPVRRLSSILSSPEFLEILERISGIPKLVSDDRLAGGGMHVMGSGGRLDVHVDFNLIRDRGLYRRLNFLLFFNEEWQDSWGGKFELWDPEVKTCLQTFLPHANRCIVFETTEESFHGVTPVTCPEQRTRNSFAAYYYTKEAPAGSTGEFHSTVFRPRPNEWWRSRVLVPAEKLATLLRLDRIRDRMRRLAG